MATGQASSGGSDTRAAAGRATGCAFSVGRRYRYALWRWWGDGDRYALFAGLNPSTADEVRSDPTVRRCIGVVRSWGYGGPCMTNLFAFRATDPEVMKAQPIRSDLTTTVGWSSSPRRPPSSSRPGACTGCIGTARPP